jgi:hypothetical protein
MSGKAPSNCVKVSFSVREALALTFSFLLLRSNGASRRERKRVLGIASSLLVGICAGEISRGRCEPDVNLGVV